jgi:hypothetical protein
MASEKDVDEVKARHSMRLLNLPGVTGVGVEQDEQGEFVLAVHVETDDPEVKKNLPDELEGCTVKVMHTGAYRKLPAH